uniref:Gustatory receptor n=1 Tax=Biomphalaria glabrata TaxID=6526 RepID=A0A2C9K7C5_BIOGL
MKGRKLLKRSVLKIRPVSNNQISLPKYCNIRDSLTPIILILKLFGLYHEVNECDSRTVEPASDSSTEVTEEPGEGGGTPEGGHAVVETLGKLQQHEKQHGLWVCLLTKCCSVLVLLIVFANTVKHLWTVSDMNSSTIAFKIVMVNWNTQNFLTTLCLFISCWKRKHFRAFYRQWMELFSEPTTRELGLQPPDCRIAIRVFVVIGSSYFLFNVASVGTIIFYDRISIQEFFRKILIDPLPINTLTLVVALFVHAINTAAWTFPTVFVVCTAHLFTAQFHTFSKTLERHIENSGGNIPVMFKHLRTRHMKLCDILGTYNLFLKWYLTFTYMATIIGSCFILYDLIFRSLDPLSFALYVFWLGTNLSIAVALSVSLSRVHESAHEPLEVLVKLETENADLSQAIQVQLFLAKLTGTSIGATVMDLFVVTKESILTIAGAYITYFLLVTQYDL